MNAMSSEAAARGQVDLSLVSVAADKAYFSRADRAT